MDGLGKVVEADETYFGKTVEQATVTTKGKPFKPGKRRGRGSVNKRPILALVERGGEVRTFHIETTDQNTVHAIMREKLDKAKPEGGNYVNTQAFEMGNRYVLAVLNAAERGEIGLAEAAEMTQLAPQHFERVRTQADNRFEFAGAVGGGLPH
jgi:hypothetical protein